MSEEPDNVLARIAKRRRLALEREFSSASHERREEIAEILKLLLRLEQTPCGSPAGATIH
jgi:hypothetical protein